MDKPVTHIQILHIVPVPFFQMFTVAAAVLPTNAGDLLDQVKNLTGECIKGAWGKFNPLNVNGADRRHRIRKRVSANDAFRRQTSTHNSSCISLPTSLRAERHPRSTRRSCWAIS